MNYHYVFENYFYLMVVVYKLVDNPFRFVGGELCLVYSSYPFVGEIDSNILVLMELLPQAPYELPLGVMEQIGRAHV